MLQPISQPVNDILGCGLFGSSESSEAPQNTTISRGDLVCICSSGPLCWGKLAESWRRDAPEIYQSSQSKDKRIQTLSCRTYRYMHQALPLSIASLLFAVACVLWRAARVSLTAAWAVRRTLGRESKESCRRRVKGTLAEGQSVGSWAAVIWPSAPIAALNTPAYVSQGYQ